MKKRKLLIGLVGVLVVFFVSFRLVNTMGPFVIIPEPFFPMSEDYAPDKEKMIDYYNKFFNGKSAEDVVNILDQYEVNYLFEGGNQIEFEVSKSFLPVPARMSGFISIEFKDGVFEKVVSIGYFSLIVP